MLTKPIDIEAGGLDAVRAIARLPQWPAWATTADLQLRVLREEAALRDDLAAYASAYAARDLDAVIAHFSDDVMITNPRGRIAGRDAIRKNYQFLFDLYPRQLDVWGNVAIRFLGSPDEAYRTAYIQEILTSPEKNHAALSTDIHRLRKVAGRWKIVERWINVEVSYPIVPRLGPPAEVTPQAV
jgi:uncharacterized protein (TIGR02246 family)